MFASVFVNERKRLMTRIALRRTKLHIQRYVIIFYVYQCGNIKEGIQAFILHTTEYCMRMCQGALVNEDE